MIFVCVCALFNHNVRATLNNIDCQLPGPRAKLIPVLFVIPLGGLPKSLDKGQDSPWPSPYLEHLFAVRPRNRVTAEWWNSLANAFRINLAFPHMSSSSWDIALQLVRTVGDGKKSSATHSQWRWYQTASPVPDCTPSLNSTNVALFRAQKTSRPVGLTVSTLVASRGLHNNNNIPCGHCIEIFWPKTIGENISSICLNHLQDLNTNISGLKV